MKVDSSNYNKQLQNEYRTLVIAYLNAFESKYEDREASARNLLSKARDEGLTEKESMSADWLRERVYQPQKYKTISQWIAKAAYFCLLDQGDWKPSKGSEWFAMVALYVNMNGGSNPNFDELAQTLPLSLKSERGLEWLRICVETILEIQKARA